VNPFAPTLTPTRSDHCLGAVFLETNPAYFFIVLNFVGFIVGVIVICIVESAAPNPLKGGSLQLQLALVDGMVLVVVVVVAAVVGLERNRCGGKTLLEITHGCPIHRRTVLLLLSAVVSDSLSPFAENDVVLRDDNNMIIMYCNKITFVNPLFFLSYSTILHTTKIVCFRLIRGL